MAEFAYNNVKNATTNHTLFEFNYDYHLCIFFEDEFDFCTRFYSANKLVKELGELISIYQQNLFHAQKL